MISFEPILNIYSLSLVCFPMLCVWRWLIEYTVLAVLVRTSHCRSRIRRRCCLHVYPLLEALFALTVVSHGFLSQSMCLVLSFSMVVQYIWPSKFLVFWTCLNPKLVRRDWSKRSLSEGLPVWSQNHVGSSGSVFHALYPLPRKKNKKKIGMTAGLFWKKCDANAFGAIGIFPGSLQRTFAFDATTDIRFWCKMDYTFMMDFIVLIDVLCWPVHSHETHSLFCWGSNDHCDFSSYHCRTVHIPVRLTTSSTIPHCHHHQHQYHFHHRSL